MSLLVIGSVALDTVSTPFGKIEEGLGGSATHFSVSASFFSPVHLVAVVGQDFPQKHIDFLISRGINIDGLQKDANGQTFRWSGHYDYDLNNAQTLKTELNVLQTFQPKIPDSCLSPDILFLANIDPELQERVIDQVKKRPKMILADTMNFWIEGRRDALLKTLSKVDGITLNEGEARLLSQESNLVKAAKAIKKMGPRIVVIKQGEYGALLFDEGSVFSAPGLPLEDIKDPTGAGDSFAGGMVGFLAKTLDFSSANFKKAIIMGSVMASFNVEEFSCDRLTRLTAEEIKNRYKMFQSLAHFDEATL